MSLADAPELVVVNKIDAVESAVVEALARELKGIPVSAAKKIGIGALLAEIDARVPRLARIAKDPEPDERQGW
jgi:50S ribosomal subunit-associated GTPase HflX